MTQEEKPHKKKDHTMKTQKTIKNAETKLEKAVQIWANSDGEGYSDGAAGALHDLLYEGCQSGIVSGLIYYTDTVKFYKKHRGEITKLLTKTLDSCGIVSAAELFGDKWEKEDPFAADDLNQNLLAWFGFEETARKLADRNGIEI